MPNTKYSGYEYGANASQSRFDYDLEHIPKPTKPIPDKVYPGVVFICFLAAIAIVIVNSIGTVIYRNIKHSEEYKEAVSVYYSEMEKWKSETIKYIKSIREGYKISENGDVEVAVDIEIDRDAKAQDVGKQMYYTLSINDNNWSEEVKWKADDTWLIKSAYVTTKVNVFNDNKFITEIGDKDPEHNDIGTVTTKQLLSLVDLDKTETISQRVVVKEYHGDFKGHQDIYNVTYTVRLSIPLGLSAEEIANMPSRPIETTKPEKSKFIYSDIGLIDCIKECPIVDVLIGIAIVGAIIVSIYYSKQVKKDNSEREQKYESAMIAYKEKIEQMKSEKQLFLNIVEHNSLRYLAHVPYGVLINGYGMPYTAGDGKYGKYTAYITPHGHCFHISPSCSKVNGQIHRHLFDVIEQYKPCQRCAAQVDCSVPQWYKDYKYYRDKCVYYGIPLKE